VPFEGFGYLPGFCGTRWGYGWQGCTISTYSSTQKHKAISTASAATSIAASGLKPADARIAVQANDGDQGAAGNKTLTAAYAAAGGTIVYDKANIPSPPPGDFTPFVNAIIAAKPNLVIANTEFTTAPGLTAALAASSYKGAFGNWVAYVPGLLDASPQLAASLQGALVTTLVVPQELGTPYVLQTQKDLTAIKHSTNISLSLGVGYAEADLLVGQLKAVGKTLNTKTWDKTINKTRFVFKPSAAGGPGQIEYPAMHFISSDCGITVKIVGTKYVPATPFTCAKSVVTTL